MLTREITLYCRHGLSISQARQLSRMAGLFKSHIQLSNLSRRQTAEASSLLALLTLATQPGDLCQLLIEGLDAELAHMAFNCWCVELGKPLGRSATAHLAEQRLATHQPDYHFALPQVASLSAPHAKAQVLAQLIGLLPESLVKESPGLHSELMAREQVSATIIRAGIAMPHVLSAAVRQPALAMLHSTEPVDWGSSLGAVHNIILLCAPRQLPPAQLRPLTRLARAMMDETLTHALLHASTHQARHAIVIEGLLS
ncbi:PTS sugar transporter subunit IIA [Aeromonas rivuli]|uniref:PTS sugar transporter subunit IIA n=1 Tax=Aeromonas rivuli TaxID=648794 RepID=UPI0005A66D80|nr:PTS sugar transporter subunit IIA [Aeromonas rivuli]